MAAFVAYLRVSTARQGVSGLGLESQRVAVEGYARSNGATLLETFVEIESGKNCGRPQLAAALARCKLRGAILVVARLDRLARDLHFVASMLKDNVEFVCCDAPFATRLTLGILAAVAEDEGRRISERTKAALAAAKARGVVLGGFRGVVVSRAAQARGRAVQSSKARQTAMALAPTIQELRQVGITTAAGIADALNQRAIPTPRNGKWYAASVARMLNRIA